MIVKEKKESNAYKGKIKAFAADFLARREEGTPLSLRDAVMLKFGVELETFMHQMGVNFAATTLADLHDSGEDYQWLYPVLVVGIIRNEIASDEFLDELLMGVEETSTGVIQYGSVDYELTNADIDQDESTPFSTPAKKSRVVISEKNIQLRGIKEVIEVGYHALKRASIDMLRETLAASLCGFKASLLRKAAHVMIHGDTGADKSGRVQDTSAPVIGVSEVGKISDLDIRRAIYRLALRRKLPTTLIYNESTGLSVASLPMFSAQSAGAPVIQLRAKKFDIRELIGIPIPYLPDSQLVVLAKGSAVKMSQDTGPLIETATDIEQQFRKIVVSTEVAFTVRSRDARIVIDKSKAYTGFPEWLQPL